MPTPAQIKSIRETNSRRLLCFPNKKNFAIFIAICYKKDKRRASVMAEIFKEFMSKIPEDKKNEYLELFKSLTKEQIDAIGKKKGDDDGC